MGKSTEIQIRSEMEMSVAFSTMAVFSTDFGMCIQGAVSNSGNGSGSNNANGAGSGNKAGNGNEAGSSNNAGNSNSATGASNSGSQGNSNSANQGLGNVIDQVQKQIEESQSKWAAKWDKRQLVRLVMTVMARTVPDLIFTGLRQLPIIRDRVI